MSEQEDIVFKPVHSGTLGIGCPQVRFHEKKAEAGLSRLDRAEVLIEKLSGVLAGYVTNRAYIHADEPFNGIMTRLTDRAEAYLELSKTFLAVKT